MKNPAKPGVSGTNGTRGVVGSGMSETTKRTLGADMIDLSVPWAKRIDPAHLAARPVDQQAMRASTFGAEGGAERETTNSPAEIGGGCTGRKSVLARWFLWVTHFAGALLLVFDLGLIFGLLAYATCASLGFLIGRLWIMGRPRASGGGVKR